MKLARATLAISSSLEFPEVVRRIAVEGGNLIGARSSLVVSAVEGGRVRVEAAHGVDSERLRSFSWEPGLAPRTDPLLLHLGPDGRGRITEVQIPDLGGRDLRLVLVHADPLTGQEEAILRAFASHSSIALRNALHHESSLAERRREGACLAAASRKLSGILDRKELIRVVCRAARELVTADGAAFILRDGDLVCYSEEDGIAPLWKGMAFPIGRCISGWSILHCAEVVIEDIYSDPRIPIEEYEKTFVKSLAMVPVRPDDPVGAIGVYWATRRRATQRELELLATLADAASISLVNARLYEDANAERRRAEGRADALLALENASVSLTRDIGERHHERAIERICRMTGASMGSFWTLEDLDGRGSLVSRWTCGFPAKGTPEWRSVACFLGDALLDSDRPIARACREERLVIVADVEAEDHRGYSSAISPATGSRFEIRSMIALPLRARGRCEGAVSLYWPDASHVHDTSVLQTAEVIANQVAAILSISGLARELSRANRIKDEFLATVSHELRNPLNVIVGYSQLILRNPRILENPEIQEAAEVIHRNAIQQADLVSDLLDLSRLRTGKLQLRLRPAILNEIVAAACGAIIAQAEAKGVAFACDSPPQAIVVEADRARLGQVLGSLLGNALKFTSAGGRIRVRLSIEDSMARIDIEDTGQGIPPHFLSELFGLFRQADAGTDRHHGGMGIGLGLVRRLVELHRGRIEAGSGGIGRGATFSVFLPVIQVGASPPRGSGAERGGADRALQSLAGLRILIVDDSADSVRALARLLRMEGAVVETACDGSAVIKATDSGDFDLLLCDISMPGMDGYELLRLLRARPGSAEVPAIALTGFGRKEDVERAIAAGFADHLTKPVGLEKLIEVARRVIAQRTLGI